MIGSTRLDLLLFGATGFTGALAVKHLVKICVGSEYDGLVWGIAGRSRVKLNNILQELKETGVDTTQIHVVVADTTDEKSLKSMTGLTKVLMNCTGPYTTLGEPVIKACLATGTHYVDITAEMHFFMNTYKKYHKAAEDANVLVVPACGYASVPAEMGLVYLERNFKGALDSAECYSELSIPKRLYFPGCDNTLVHYGTWASLVYELKNFRQYRDTKKTTFPEDIYSLPTGLTQHSFLHRKQGKFWFPYPGPDDEIIDMTQRYLAKHASKKPVRFNSYTTMPTLFHLLVVLPAFMFYYYASFMACFRKLLWKFPRFFTLGYMSHKGPSERNMKDTKFSFVLTGRGRDQSEKDDDSGMSNKTMTVKVSGEDAYNITAVAFVLSAITLLKERPSMAKGGVLTSGAAFYNTSLLDILIKNNKLQFEITDSPQDIAQDNVVSHS